MSDRVLTLVSREQAASISSKHGLITSAGLHYAPPLVADELHEADAEDACLSLGNSLVGDRYGSLDGTSSNVAMTGTGGRMQRDIIEWLQHEM